MKEAVFWALIAMLDWSSTGDDEAVVEPLVEKLSEMDESEIFAFDDLLAEKLYALDTINHAKNIGDESYEEGEYFSDDFFLYVRCAAVANGKKFYYKAVKRPKKMPQDVEFEALLYVAEEAYSLKTEGNYEHSTPVSWETGSNTEGWK